MTTNIDAFTPIRNSFNANDIKYLLNEYLIDQRISNIFNFKNISSINNIRDNSILFIKENNDIHIKKKKFPCSY